MRFISSLLLVAAVATTSAVTVAATEQHHKNLARHAAPAVTTPAPEEFLRKRLDADDSALAVEAESIYENYGTTAFAAPTNGACPAGYTSWTDATGTLRCCAGSIINKHCFVDTLDILYTVDPDEVLNGDIDAPDAASAASAGADSVSNSVQTTTTMYSATQTGATTGKSSTSSSATKLSLTLSATGKSISVYVTTTASQSITTGSTSGARSIGGGSNKGLASLGVVAVGLVAGSMMVFM